MNASEALAWTAKNKMPLKIIADRCPEVHRSKLEKWRRGKNVSAATAAAIAQACASIQEDVKQAMIGKDGAKA